MANVTGYATYQPSLHFYLFSADGRVYRHYDALDVPGRDPSQFDFDRAQREDPLNSGRYAVQGGTLVMQMGNGTITAPAPRGGVVTIESVAYTRQ
jgi:hypothetical protein